MQWFPLPPCFPPPFPFFPHAKMCITFFPEGGSKLVRHLLFFVFGLAGGLLFSFLFSFFSFDLTCGPFYNCILYQEKTKSPRIAWQILSLAPAPTRQTRRKKKGIRYGSKHEMTTKEKLIVSHQRQSIQYDASTCEEKKEAEASCWSVRCVAFLPRRIESPIWRRRYRKLG